MQTHFSMPWAPQMRPPAAERSFIPGRACSVRWTPALSCFSCRAWGCGSLAAAAHAGGSTGGSANTSTRGAAGHKKNHIYRATVSFNGLRVQRVTETGRKQRAVHPADPARKNTGTNTDFTASLAQLKQEIHG